MGALGGVLHTRVHRVQAPDQVARVDCWAQMIGAGDDDTAADQNVKEEELTEEKQVATTSITVSADRPYQSGDLKTPLRPPPKRGSGLFAPGERGSLLASSISLSGPPETKTGQEQNVRSVNCIHSKPLLSGDLWEPL